MIPGERQLENEVTSPQRGKNLLMRSAALVLLLAESSYAHRAYLTTSISHFRKTIQSSPELEVHLDLISTIHIADQNYYRNIERMVESKDVVLYELVTSRANVAYNQSRPFMKRIINPVVSTATESLRTSLGLSSQLSMNYQDTVWSIADFSIEEIHFMEAQNRTKRSNYNDWTGSRIAASLLSAFSWLTPCPELGCLLVQWGTRETFTAGGVSKLLVSVFAHLLYAFSPFTSDMSPEVCWSSVGVVVNNLQARQRSIQAARKLALAQHILSGLIDDGSFGGQAESDVDVRVYARNAECCRLLDAYLQDYSQNRGSHVSGEETKLTVRIAIIYGAYHIRDLTRRLLQVHGFERDRQRSYSTLTAWTIPAPPISAGWDTPDSAEKGLSVAAAPLTSSAAHWGSIGVPAVAAVVEGAGLANLTVPQRTVLAVLALMYLAVGALDWWSVYQLLALTMKDVVATAPVAITEQRVLIEVAWAVAYVVLYVLRHAAILRALRNGAVQWDRGLFADATHNK